MREAAFVSGEMGVCHVEYVIMRDHPSMNHRDEASEKYKLHRRVVGMVSNSFKTHRNVISDYFTCLVSVLPKKYVSSIIGWSHMREAAFVSGEMGVYMLEIAVFSVLEGISVSNSPRKHVICISQSHLTRAYPRRIRDHA